MQVQFRIRGGIKDMQIYHTEKRYNDLKQYAEKHNKSMTAVLWEAFYKLIGKPMP